jgi:hypothetical protein
MAFDSTEVAWRDMTLYMNGARVSKFTLWKSKTLRESEYLHAEGDDPFDINPGNKTYQAQFGAYKSVIDLMNDIAVKAGGNDLTDITWTITVVYKATATSPKRTVTYPKVMFEEFEEGLENNNKSMVIVMTAKHLLPIRS